MRVGGRIYVPVANWQDDMRTHAPSCTVLELEPVQRFSGLYDAGGNKLMVTVQTEPIGFIHYREK